MIRLAVPADIPDIVRLIRELAEYEKLLDRFTLEEASLHEHLFGPQRKVEVLLAEDGGKIVGYAVFFHNFSTFLGRPGIYLEDLFVQPAFRGKGHGKALLAAVAAVAVERGCTRMEWVVLDWNEPARKFYKGIGAQHLKDWQVFALRDEALKALANTAPR